jgi:hypothetical protein
MKGATRQLAARLGFKLRILGAATFRPLESSQALQPFLQAQFAYPL